MAGSHGLRDDPKIRLVDFEYASAQNLSPGVKSFLGEVEGAQQRSDGGSVRIWDELDVPPRRDKAAPHVEGVLRRNTQCSQPLSEIPESLTRNWRVKHS